MATPNGNLAPPPRSPQVGLFIPLGEGPPPIGWDELVSLAQRAEELGFDAVWLLDHLQFEHGETTIGVWECWTFLAGLATMTKRVKIGPLVTSTTYRNPALLAKMAESVDAMSGGRLVLGIGAGHWEGESRAFNFPFDHRASRFEEAIQIITGLLRDRKVNVEGTYYAARNAVLQPAGPRPHGLPVMVGARGPRMIRIAARHADELNIDAGTTLETIGPLSAEIDDACREVGRDPATLRRSAFIGVDLSSPSLPGDPWMEMIQFEKWSYRGSAAELAGILRAYAAAGFSEIQVWLNPCTIAGIEALAQVLDLLNEEPAQPRPPMPL